MEKPGKSMLRLANKEKSCRAARIGAPSLDRNCGRHNLNNVIEQDHRTVKKRVWLAKGYGSFQSAWRTLQGIEAVNMIRKGRVRWLAKGDVVGQAHFIGELFGLST
jgi:transposase-like protein